VRRVKLRKRVACDCDGLVVVRLVVSADLSEDVEKFVISELVFAQACQRHRNVTNVKKTDCSLDNTIKIPDVEDAVKDAIKRQKPVIAMRSATDYVVRGRERG